MQPHHPKITIWDPPPVDFLLPYLLTQTVLNAHPPPPRHVMRTHTCGALRLGDVGRRVRLCGWIQRPRVMGDITFVPLRDRFGT
eukprot:COSAG04_NODE_3077_length_3191_cov_48.002264_7_plen_83_part_01